MEFPHRSKRSELSNVIDQLRSKMEHKAYTAERLAVLCGKNVPAMRRFLRPLEGLGLLIVNKDGKKKYYVLKEHLKEYQSSCNRCKTETEEKQKGEKTKIEPKNFGDFEDMEH